MLDRAERVHAQARPRVELLDDGIVQIDYGEMTAVTLDTCKYTFRTRCELTGGAAAPVLFTGDRLVHYDRDAAEFSTSPTVAATIVAAALVPKGTLARNLTRLFLLYHRPPYPCRVFSTVDDARAWLRERIH